MGIYINPNNYNDQATRAANIDAYEKAAPTFAKSFGWMDCPTREVISDYYDRLIGHISFVREAGKSFPTIKRRLKLHDMSKFDFEEFYPYAVKFCGKANHEDAFTRAWLRHIHHNDHHWNHWIFPSGSVPKATREENGAVPMPIECVMEMVADWMGASMAYTGSYEMTDWLSSNISRIRLHSHTVELVNPILASLGYRDVLAENQWGAML